MTEARQRAAARLRGDPYRRLWERARRALERNGLVLDGATASVPEPSEAELAALSGLLGRPRRPAKAMRVRLDDLDRALRQSGLGSGLIEWLTELSGPLRNRPAERAAGEERARALWATADGHPLAGEPWVAEWLDDLRRDGLLKRIAQGVEEEVLADALQVLEHLPAGGVPLPVLAGAITGDSKRLTDTALATVVERALTARSGVPRPRTAGERRALWAEFGVIFDDLSSQVLALNLPTGGIDLLSSWLSDARSVGEPFRVTLRQLVNSELEIEPEPVRICENVGVVMEAANQLGAECEPLVCTEGQLSDACHRLLEQLVAAGCPLSYHGDFDWAGVCIASAVIQRHGAVPWRLGAADYHAAVERVAGSPPRLRGGPVVAPWDPDLASQMETTGVAVLEEHVLADLLVDLAR